jgi:hypothetical protein
MTTHILGESWLENVARVFFFFFFKKKNLEKILRNVNKSIAL